MMPYTYRAATVQEAIRLAKAELGPDALILEVRRISPVVPGQSREGTVEISAIAAHQQGLAGPLIGGALRGSPVRVPSTRAHESRAHLSQPAEVAFRRLQSLGISAALAERLARTYDSARSRPAEERRAALAAAIARQISFCELPPADRRPAIVALIGPSGVGKTTTIAKLASQLRSQHARIAMLGLDPNPVTGSLLAAWAEHLGIPCAVVGNRAELAEAVAAAGRADLILIDTPGCNPYDQAQVKRLRDDLGSRDPIVCCLALAVTGDTAELIDIGRRFLRLNPTALVLTKLDETRRAASCVGIAEQLGLPLAGLTTGPQVPDDLVPASPAALAELVAWTLDRELRSSPAPVGPVAHRP